MKGIFIIILILGLLFLYFLFSISIKNEDNYNSTSYLNKKLYIENFIDKKTTNDSSKYNTLLDNNKSALNSDPNLSKYNKTYLYPIRGLQSICEKEGLKPSFMPKSCYLNDVLNPYANCKCEDESGKCKICYETINKDTQNSNIVYGGSNF